jgi:4-carboxymuconolactone decarboxylase
VPDTPPPPQSYKAFVERFPALGEAWQKLREGAATGPLSEREQRLVKLAVAIGSQREGAVHSAARKALGAGVTQDEMMQVIANAASTVGLPSSVAAFTWIQDVVAPD